VVIECCDVRKETFLLNEGFAAGSFADLLTAQMTKVKYTPHYFLQLYAGALSSSSSSTSTSTSTSKSINTTIPNTWLAEWNDCFSNSFTLFQNDGDSITTPFPHYPKCFLVPKTLTREVMVKASGLYNCNLLPIASWMNSNARTILWCSGGFSYNGGISTTSKSTTTNSSSLALQTNNKLLQVLASIGRNTATADTTPSPLPHKFFILRDYDPSLRTEHEGYMSLPPNCYLDNLNGPMPIEVKKFFYEVVQLCIQTVPSVVLKSPNALSASESKKQRPWYPNILRAEWNSCVSKTLSAAIRVSSMLTTSSVLINSRISFIITVLVQLLNDPAARTIDGVLDLFDRFWIAEVNLFSSDSTGVYKDDQRGPVFLMLLLHCIYQIIARHSCAFEFNEDFLLTIIEEYFIGR